MATSLELTSVQKGRGKVHLAAAVRGGEPVRTLCGQSFAADGYRAVEADADCSICLRRRRDPTVVAQAFFAADPDRVLELSVAQAQARRRDAPSPPPSEPARSSGSPRLRVVPEPRPRPSPPAAPPEPQRVGELDAQGLREFSENVFVAADGSIVRMKDGRVEEVLGEGKFQLLRRGDRFELRAGDVVLRGRIEDVEASGPRP